MRLYGDDWPVDSGYSEGCRSSYVKKKLRAGLIARKGNKTLYEIRILFSAQENGACGVDSL